MRKILLLLTLLLYSCTHDICHCTETITDIKNNRLYINDYVIECDNPYNILETYEWGNIVTDCR